MNNLRQAFVVITLVVMTAGMLAGQEPTKAAALSQARRALGGGQAALALRTIEPLLAKAPGDRELVDFVISVALSMDDVSRALSTYDGFVQATNQDSAVVLRAVALYELRKLVGASQDDPRLRAEALERLARGGDAKAANGLRGVDTGWPGQQSLLADAALARLGDNTAVNRLAAAAGTPDQMGKVPAAEAIVSTGNPALGSSLVPLLRHPDPRTRIAAVEGIAKLGYRDALNDVKALLTDQVIEVRGRAALALARLGDSSGQAIVASMMRSPVGDVRLRALDADRSISSGERISALRDILADPDPLT